MGSFLITLLVIAAITLIVRCICGYISTLSERRFFYNEKIIAEQAKQNARIAGDMTREIIDKIARSK